MKNTDISPRDFTIARLGQPRIESPLVRYAPMFVRQERRIAFPRYTDELQHWIDGTGMIPSFEHAGPRERIFFDPAKTSCGIVTCGGLCPGINDVIRAIVYEAYEAYGVNRVYGFRYGYRGMVKGHSIPPVVLDTEMVNDIHKKGGTVLGSSRGLQDVRKMVDYLEELQISILFAIGGDGTLRGASAIAAEVAGRGLEIAVVGIPKTIDNDILFVEETFGFKTAVEEAMEVIQSAHVESKGAENGIGLVKLMGRDSGFIAAQATLANADVNFCLVPEVPFSLEGEDGLFAMLEKRLLRRGHAVVVAAEGAGQQHIGGEHGRDGSGNVLHGDIGVFLKHALDDHFRKKNFPVTIKYIDPSYTIRSKPANAQDSQICLHMGQCAVHAGMSGCTDMLTGYWDKHYTHVPIRMATARRKTLDPQGFLWQTVLSVTEHGTHCMPNA